MSNVPIMYLALPSLAYRAYATTFEALNATFFRHEHVLQFPGHQRHDTFNEWEFVAEENVNYEKDKLTPTNKEASNTANKTSPAEIGPEGKPGMRAFTFDPTPPPKKDKEFHLTAADDQAKLMRWHYCVGHLSFPKLKLLTINGEIP